MENEMKNKEKNVEKITSGDWANYIDLCEEDQNNGMRPYALQFANCERIAKNDAVFLFDEVGSGKTISTGLMAMECLEKSDLNGSRGDVLVITVPQLARPLDGYPKGQFYGDWENRLGSVIKEKEWKKRIHVINNHYKNIQEWVCDKKYALVIVDEAHLFLKASKEQGYEKKMLQELYKIKAEKVVLATATPIKYDSEKDLREYAEIVQEILCGTENDPDMDAAKNDKFRENVRECYNTLCKSLIPQKKEGAADYKIISSVFDPTCSVTRYFKDTIRCLTEKKECENKNGCRAQAELWYPDPDKDAPEKEQLIDKIYTKTKEGNRFIVFTRYLADAEELKNICIEKDIRVKSVNGKNSKELGLYSGLKEGEDELRLPQVLILTDRLAEQGVNFPMYNYVVNYYISPFPANLEQRFGRVDRLNSKYEKIYMCYWMRYKNLHNFYRAFDEYIYDLLADIPSRNVLLTEEIFNLYLQNRKEQEELRKHKIELLEEKSKDCTACVEELIRSYEQDIEKSEDIEKYTDMDYLRDLSGDIWTEIQDKLNERVEASTEDIMALDEEIAELKAVLPESLEKELKRLKKEGEKGLDESGIENIRKIIELKDGIFYFTDKLEKRSTNQVIASNIKAISLKKCAKMIIGEEENVSDESDNSESAFYKDYEDYRARFEREITLSLLLSNPKIKGSMNEYFEKLFMDNDTEFVFPPGGYKSTFEKMLNQPAFSEISDKDKTILKEHCNAVVHRLPFFQMCDEFGEILIQQGYTCENQGRALMTFHKNPFESAVEELGKRIKDKESDLKDLSGTFKKKYWNISDDECIDNNSSKNQYYELFGFDISDKVDGRKIVKATEWYRLAYHYTGCFAKDILECDDIASGELGYKKYRTGVKIASPYYAVKLQLQKIHCKEKREKITLESPKENLSTFFGHYMYSQNMYREWVNYFMEPEWVINEMKLPKEKLGAYVDPKDIWTMGILWELVGADARGHVWGDILDLPETLQNKSVFDNYNVYCEMLKELQTLELSK